MKYKYKTLIVLLLLFAATLASCFTKDDKQEKEMLLLATLAANPALLYGAGIHITGKVKEIDGAGIPATIRINTADKETGEVTEELTRFDTHSDGSFSTTISEKKAKAGSIIMGEIQAFNQHSYIFYFKVPSDFTDYMNLSIEIALLPLDYFNGYSLASLSPATGNVMIQKVNQPIKKTDELILNEDAISLDDAENKSTLYIFDKPGADYSSSGYLDRTVPSDDILIVTYNRESIAMQAVSNSSNTFLTWLVQ